MSLSPWKMVRKSQAKLRATELDVVPRSAAWTTQLWVQGPKKSLAAPVLERTLQGSCFSLCLCPFRDLCLFFLPTSHRHPGLQAVSPQEQPGVGHGSSASTG